MTDAPYLETEPPRALALYVDRLWSRRSDTATGGAHRVLPDGCLDLLVDVRAGTAELVGPMRSAALVPAGAGDVVAVRFRPGAGARFAGLALEALVDESVPLVDLGIDAGPLLDALHGTSLRSARLAALAGFVRDRLADADPLDRLARRAVDRITRGARSIDALSAELGVSRQYLARTFAREVGISPKALARIARMQRVVIAIHAGRHDWAALATELGFADQSHLVHDARALAGASPARLAAESDAAPVASLYGAA